MVVAIAIWPLFEQLRLHERHRTLAALIVTVLVGAILIVPLIVLGVEIGREAADTLQWMRMVERDGVPPPDWLVHLPLVGSYLGDWWQTELSEPRGASIYWDVSTATGSSNGPAFWAFSCCTD